MYYKDIIKEIMLKFLSSDAYIDFLIWKRGLHEPEIELLPLFCDKEHISIDVGASDGVYTIHLYKLSKMCYAFEPRTDAFERLSRLFNKARKPIKLDTYALSDTPGEAVFKIFPAECGRSTIEAENDLEKEGNVEYCKVMKTTIDNYSFNGKIGFIKIDVEGHEEAVLRGAGRIITEDKPAFLIEIEDRHKAGAINSVANLLKGYGYKGFFYKGKKLFPMERFNKEVHQNEANLAEGKGYYNNFIFIHELAIAKFDKEIFAV